MLKVDMMAAPISVDDIDGTSCNEGRAEQQAACNKTRRKKRKSSNKGEFIDRRKFQYFRVYRVLLSIH